MDFKYRLFDDWSAEQWNAFYLQMVAYCQSYLNNGIIVSEPINLLENKLKIATDISFVEFADANIVFEENTTEVIKNKASLYEAFRLNYPVESKNVSNIMFKKWLDKWAFNRGVDVTHYKSNSNAMVKFIKNEQLCTV
jgi:hypothetical protein